MEAKYSSYDFNESIERIAEVLNSSDAEYKDKDSIPSRDALTFNNGFYVSCSALFVDIRGSKSLSEKHSRPVLAKIYKTYISELIAVLREHWGVNQIYIEGDCVWGIFETSDQFDFDCLFTVAKKASSLVDILNIKYKKKGYSEIKIGIGISYGESLMIKSGYKTSGINEITWVGKLVGEAAKLCSYGNREFYDKEIQVSKEFYDRLSESNKSNFSKNLHRDCYHSNAIDSSMNELVKQNG